MKIRNLVLLFCIFTLSFLSGAFVRFVSDPASVALLNEETFSAQLAVPEQAPEKKSGGTELLFVGDVMLSRGVEYYIEKNGGDYRCPFLLMADTLRSADILVGNLENPISIRGKNQGSEYSFRANPKSLDGLNFAGFDVLALANNHMWDYGAEALADTKAFLDEWGIKSVGAGENYFEANEPAKIEKNGTTFAFFSFTNLYPESLEATASRPGISQFETQLIREQIAKSKKNGEFAIVLLHWGEEYETSANSFQQDFARELIDAGADLVIGTHPHVVQEVEKYKNGWIVYSLGNFVFDQRFSEDTSNGLMFGVTVSNGTITEVRQTKIEFTKTFQPKVVK